MYIETEMRNAVVSYSGLENSKVFLTTALENTVKPYIVINLISNVRKYSHDGFSGLTESRYQVNINTEKYEQTKLIAKSLHAIDQYKSETIASIEIDNIIDGFDNGVNNYTAIIDLMVQHYNE